MKLKFFISILVLIIGCKPKQIKENQSILKVDTIDHVVTNIKMKEDFKEFFQKFKTDSLFQRQRIDNPLTFIISEDDVEEVTNQQVNYVSFNAKDWDMKISVKTEKLSKDTINVILEGIDTGVHIEHMFVNRDLGWYLFQIKNLSD